MSRKITQESVRNFLDGVPFKKSNMSVVREGTIYYLKLQKINYQQNQKHPKILSVHKVMVEPTLVAMKNELKKCKMQFVS